MITGLRLRIASSEIKTHCLERAKFHDGRAALKEGELPKLQSALDAIRAVSEPQPQLSHMSKVSSTYHADLGSEIENLERDIRNHKNQAMVFRFFSEHLFDEDYDLQEADLQRLEITKR